MKRPSIQALTDKLELLLARVAKAHEQDAEKERAWAEVRVHQARMQGRLVAAQIEAAKGTTALAKASRRALKK